MKQVHHKSFANGQHDLRRGIDFVGVTCSFLCHDGKGNLLLHKRRRNCRDEHGHWDCGAGALEKGEEVEKAVRREIKEEYGTDVVKLQFMGYLDVHRQLADGTPTHWICLMHAAQVNPSQARNNEPFKIDEIGWFRKDTLPKPPHSQLKNAIAAAQALGII